MEFFNKVYKNGFLIIFSVMFFYVMVVLYADFDEFSSHIKKIDYGFVPIILSLMSIHIIILGLRFHQLVSALGIDIAWKKSILIYIAGLSLTIIPGGAGQIIKSHFIKKEYGIEISKTAPIILVEKWNELVSVLIILLLSFLILIIIEALIIAIIGIIIMLILAVIMRSQKGFTIFKKVISHFKFLIKFIENVENSQKSFRLLMSKKMILGSLALTTPAKFLELIAVYFVFLSVGINLDFILSLQIFITSLLTGVLSFIPGGFGVTEASMLGLLLKYVNNLSLAAVGVILVRLSTIWFATILGLIITKKFIKIKN